MNDTPAVPISSFCYCVAVLLLGETLARGAKQFDAIALTCVASAIFAVALPLVLGPVYINRRALNALIGMGIFIGFCRLWFLNPFIFYPASRRLLLPFALLAGIAAVLSILILLQRPRSLVGVVFVLLLLDVGLMGWFHINLAASPHVDVYVIQDLGGNALLDGNNPYAITFPDIYGPGAGFYPPNAVVNGQVQSGYFYPPLSLLLDLPGILLGDLRYAHLAAVLTAAALIGYSQRNFAPAVWLLFTPQLLFILENSWIESFAVLMLAVVVWCGERRKVWLVPIAVGLLLVTKQYLLLTVPAAVLLLPTPWRWATTVRFVMIAAICGSVVTLPFILWNPPAFFHSMTTLYTNILRPDSISFLPIIAHVLGTRLTLLCPIVAAFGASIVILLRSPRSTSAFAAAVALICLCAFAFSTQAFINYYFFAIAALLSAVAAPGSMLPAREIGSDVSRPSSD